jgi:hypothetical protein
MVYGSADKAHLVIKTFESAFDPSSLTDADTRETDTSYDANLNPQVTTTDPGGLNLKNETDYSGTGGQIADTILPGGFDASGNPTAPGAHQTDYLYFDPASSDSYCSAHVEWNGQLCKTQPHAQPRTGISRSSRTRTISGAT